MLSLPGPRVDSHLGNHKNNNHNNNKKKRKEKKKQKMKETKEKKMGTEPEIFPLECYDRKEPPFLGVGVLQVLGLSRGPSTNWKPGDFPLVGCG